MGTLLWVALWLGGLIALAYCRASLLGATGAIAAGLVVTTIFSSMGWFTLTLCWVLFAGVAILLNNPEYRKRFITNPAFDALSKSLPPLSETERVALEAGTVGWEGELFSGQPQWEKLLTIPTPKLTEEEEAFLNGPVKTLCEMTNDWEITHTLNDLPETVWQFIIENGFFALVIPKKFGGKGFSEYAHSEILCTLAGRSLTLASTVAVPNSLGPAELILRYGTQAQTEYYLPRLASGKEIPCFALTAPEAGSDAGAIPDTGVICKGQFEGKEIVGIKLNWNKRYITLAPVATLLGLAFKLYDPEHLLGEKKELGITCALIPTNTPGVTTGRRHMPSNIPFQNGPTQGKDVFIPVDWIIGGANMAGHGWRMLMECLSTGRAVSLPSSSAGGARNAALTCGAYSRIRRQFNTSIANFEGIQEALGRIGGMTYLCEAVRNLTVAMVDAGEKPSVPSAIAKYHVTELGRKIANDAMDIHGGKGIMMGPSNYLCRTYQGVPIGITVEGANILTRNMIIFGQGAIRCHPYVLKEMHAMQHHNVQEFEHYMGQHIRFTLSNAAHALFNGLTFARFASSPTTTFTKRYYQQLSRASSAFALVADASMAILGGKLKFKESISSRLGDLLAMMYLMSAVLKRHQDQGSQATDIPLVRWSLDYCLAEYWKTMDALLRNFPQRAVAFGLRALVMPFGIPCHYPNDKLNREITDILTTQNEARTRLTQRMFISNSPNDPIRIIANAFDETLTHATLIKTVFDASKNHEEHGTLAQSIEFALTSKIITDEEAKILNRVNELCQAVIAVDDFSKEEMGGSASVAYKEAGAKKATPKTRHDQEGTHRLN